MFNYRCSRLRVINNKVLFDDGIKLHESSGINNFLASYEKEVYSFVKSKKKSFKYIQGLLPSNFFVSLCEGFFGKNSAGTKIYNLTQHPNFAGGIVINTFLNFKACEKNFVITYENPISENWLNSKVGYMDVVNLFNALVSKTKIKHDIEIVFIRIFNSSMINFVQVNVGSKVPKFELK